MDINIYSWHPEPTNILTKNGYIKIDNSSVGCIFVSPFENKNLQILIEDLTEIGLYVMIFPEYKKTNTIHVDTRMFKQR